MTDQHEPEVFVDKTPDLGYDLEDFGMDEAQLRAKYDREHPVYTNLDYNYAIKDLLDQEAIPSYWTWVIQKIAKDDEAMPGNDEQGNPLPTEGDPKQELVTMNDVDVFAGHLVAWHGRQMRQAEHLFKVPEGTAIEVQIGESDTPTDVVLEGEKLRAFLGGVSACLSLFDQLPFAAIAVDELKGEAPKEADAGG